MGVNTFSGEVAEGVQLVHGENCGNCYGKLEQPVGYRVPVSEVRVRFGRACMTGTFGINLVSVKNVPSVIT